MPSGLEALARAKAFRERATDYEARAQTAVHLAARESYLQLAVTYGRLADDMDHVAKMKRYALTESGPAG